MNRAKRRSQARSQKHAGSLDYSQLHRDLLDFHRRHREKRAVEIYRQVLRDSNPHAQHLFGVTALRHECFEVALKLLRSATERLSGSADLYNHLGLAEWRGGSTELAEPHFRRALELDASHHQALVNWGLWCRDAGQLEAAIAHLRHAARVSPRRPAIHLQLAELLLELADPTAAQDSIAAALELEPGSAWGVALRTVALSETRQDAEFQSLVACESLVVAVETSLPDSAPSLKHWNASLKGFLCTHRGLERAKDSRSTQQGWQTKGNLFEDPSPLMRGFEASLRLAIQEYQRRVSGDALPMRMRPGAFRLEGWGVQLRRGGFQAPHIHRDGWLSGVYYVDVEDAVRPDDEAREGWIEFGRGPDPLRPLGFDPPTTYSLAPRAGHFVLFPSWLWHRTIPFWRGRDRVSLAFDVIAL